MSRRRGGRSPRRAGANGLSQALVLVPVVLGQLGGIGLVDDWSVLDARWTVTGTATIFLGVTGRGRAAVLRMSSTGVGRLRHESAVLRALAAVGDRTEGALPLTRRRADGAVEGWYCVLDDYVEGRDASEVLSADPSLRSAVERAGVAAIDAFHRTTARPVTIGVDLLRRWVDEPLDVLARDLLLSSRLVTPGRLEALRRRLHRNLEGRQVQAGWVHGDLWWGNVRVDPATGAITGVVDWDCAEQDELPAHDLLHLALYDESLRRGVGLGTLVAQVVEAGTWPAECDRLIRHGRWGWAAQVSDVDVALLYWLRYTARMIDQQRDYVDHSVLAWEWRNVVPVLRSIRRDGTPARIRITHEGSASGGASLGGLTAR